MWVSWQCFSTIEFYSAYSVPPRVARYYSTLVYFHRPGKHSVPFVRLSRSPIRVYPCQIRTKSQKLIAITSSLQVYDPPIEPYETYTQGFWYAIAAAAFYLFCSVILMMNMLGHFLGHYPDTFELTDSQRTLILQTMMFFGWLAGGAAVFAKIEQDADVTGWSFTDAVSQLLRSSVLAGPEIANDYSYTSAMLLS